MHALHACIVKAGQIILPSCNDTRCLPYGISMLGDGTVRKFRTLKAKGKNVEDAPEVNDSFHVGGGGGAVSLV